MQHSPDMNAQLFAEQDSKSDNNGEWVVNNYDEEGVDEDDNDNNPLSDLIASPDALFTFQDEGLGKEAVDLYGKECKAIEYSACSLGTKMQNPIETSRLCKWFILRSTKEATIRQSQRKTQNDLADMGMKIVDVSVYQCRSFSEVFDGSNDHSDVDCVVNSASEHSSSTISRHLVHQSPSCSFSADFQGGNTEKVIRVYGRETISMGQSSNMKWADSSSTNGSMKPITSSLSDRINIMKSPNKVNQEYDITLRKDLFTKGYVQWYYFAVTSPKKDEQGVRFPLTVRFNLVNLKKSSSLYNYGMRVACYCCRSDGNVSDTNANIKYDCWLHDGQDVCYYKNAWSNGDGSSGREGASYTLSFTYTFYHPQQIVYFAHSFPYSYNDLQKHLRSLESDARIALFFRRTLLAQTLAKNRCDMITICEPVVSKQDEIEHAQRPAIVVTSRVHPGESNSSYMMEGFLNYLCADTEESYLLRKHFVFKIVPMLNPDGVIHGNYRCSLAGTDLNRRYLDCDEAHPTISALKRMMENLSKTRNILLFLDLHGHSKLKNAFVYGCDLALESQKASKVKSHKSAKKDVARQVYPRVFPSILCSEEISVCVNESNTSCHGRYFSWQDCSFAVQSSKVGTGRVSCWKKSKIEGAYTIELSFCGGGLNSDTKLLKKVTSNRYINAHASGMVYDDGGPDVANVEGELAKLNDRFNAGLLHYSIDDFVSMGHQLGKAIVMFANLPSCLSDATPTSPSLGRMFDGVADARSPVKQSVQIVTMEAGMLDTPIRQPCLFSLASYQTKLSIPRTVSTLPLSRQQPASHTTVTDAYHDYSLRLKAELRVRRSLGRPFDNFVSMLNPDLQQFDSSDFLVYNADVAPDGDGVEAEMDEGSDSDPSGDDLPLNALRVKKLFELKKSLKTKKMKKIDDFDYSSSSKATGVNICRPTRPSTASASPTKSLEFMNAKRMFDPDYLTNRYKQSCRDELYSNLIKDASKVTGMTMQKNVTSAAFVQKPVKVRSKQSMFSSSPARPIVQRQSSWPARTAGTHSTVDNTVPISSPPLNDANLHPMAILSTSQYPTPRGENVEKCVSNQLFQTSPIPSLKVGTSTPEPCSIYGPTSPDLVSSMAITTERKTKLGLEKDKEVKGIVTSYRSSSPVTVGGGVTSTTVPVKNNPTPACSLFINCIANNSTPQELKPMPVDGASLSPARSYVPISLTPRSAVSQTSSNGVIYVSPKVTPKNRSGISPTIVTELSLQRYGGKRYTRSARKSSAQYTISSHLQCTSPGLTRNLREPASVPIISSLPLLRPSNSTNTNRQWL